MIVKKKKYETNTCRSSRSTWLRMIKVRNQSRRNSRPIRPRAKAENSLIISLKVRTFPGCPLHNKTAKERQASTDGNIETRGGYSVKTKNTTTVCKSKQPLRLRYIASKTGACYSNFTLFYYFYFVIIIDSTIIQLFQIIVVDFRI